MSETILALLTAYHLPAIFLGSFFFGETVIISAAFLAGQGLFSPMTVFWLSLLGTVASDSLWYLFGQKLLTIFHRWDTYKRNSEKVLAALESITGKQAFLSLLFIKFLYGTRILTIIYLSMRRMGFWFFTGMNTVGSIIWLVVLIPLGYLAGKSVADLLPLLHRVEYGALFLILVLLVFRFGTAWLSKKITKE